ncbi:hypothetical protein J2Y03_004264 [Neobacillus niacini]|uniref:hypothetical protein n=1 Tax=Neobacillus niacini TaxID=86668 RepID=UPI00285EC82B|nr:hypothetical protein [Neobacillus niacini]MDR7079206.1 hypothetical protein [Neobacillus niacini]
MKSKIHRCNCRKVWSIQNRKSKVTAHSILLTGEWSAELKPERKCDPRGFVTTDRSQEIVINPPHDFIKNFVKVEKLIYDKKKVNFNIKNGKYLLFAEDGNCYILKKDPDNLLSI